MARNGDEQRDSRIYLATERTFLARIRTALALMAFGFVVARFSHALVVLPYAQNRDPR
ncbi:MAG: DUF202 domain-containing protein [Acidobacteria bacterium]|nr:DUF202 domain-containing protein [Acidobacteriota bacterium]